MYDQEIFTDANTKIKDDKLCNHIHNIGLRAFGGVSILVRNNIPQSKIHLDTNLKAIAVKATMHREINICLLYIPPDNMIDKSELIKLIA